MLIRYIEKFTVLLGARLVGAAAMFLMTAVIAHKLGLSALGEFAIYVAISNIFAAIGSRGYNTIGILFTSEYQANSKNSLLSGFVGSAFNSSISIFIALLSILAPILFIFVHLLSIEQSAIIIGSLFTGASIAALNLNSSIMSGLGKQQTGLLPETLFRPLLCTVIVLIFLYSGLWQQGSIIHVIAASTIGSMFSVIVAYWFSKKTLAKYSRKKPTYEKGRWHKAANPWLVQSILNDYLIDILLLISALVMSSPQIAILHVCFKLRAIAGFGMRTIYMLTLPEISKIKATGTPSGVLQKVMMTNYFATAYSVLVLVAYSIFGSQLLQLFSIDGQENLMTLLVVTFVIFFRAIFGPSAFVLSVHDKHHGSLVVMAIGALFAISCMAFIQPITGAYGTALAYCFSMSFVAAITAWHCWKVTDLNTSIFQWTLKPTSRSVAS